MNKIQQDFLHGYLKTLSVEERLAIPEYSAEYFGLDDITANECAMLVNQGIKRATCSLKIAYDMANEPLPKVGRITVVLNWQQEPVCIIKLTEIHICSFDNITPEFAVLEGEGDGSYEWWKKAHIGFFSQYASRIGTTFSKRSEIVLEYFEKVYPI
ncbi:ASCH domain-containing protein [Pasteurellaceae bacterium HPA106]|uniref:ASCH domain-containing protein n=1 Tax=Spirabiliibacterium pneumoniae TaxID=221400 RepID=UPI001AAD260A|nr:ASCH domain-containing protein [Spirabiliibacterium pneumoniae]MBE2896221.1 ASCH domain-containing protein [Spirabiliibacterium pneumoniae]